MRVDARGTVFTLPDTVQVKEDGFDIIFVLEEKSRFYGLT
jgi:hypothetical protein